MSNHIQTCIQCQNEVVPGKRVCVTHRIQSLTEYVEATVVCIPHCRRRMEEATRDHSKKILTSEFKKMCKEIDDAKRELKAYGVELT